MMTYCSRGDDRPTTDLGSPETEVCVLTVHKEGQVEAAQFMPQFSLYHHECPGDDRRETHLVRVGRPGPRRLRIEERIAGKDGVQANRET